MRRLVAVCLIAALGALPISAAEDPAKVAMSAAERLRAAGDGLAAAKSARNRVTALSETIRAYEDGLGAMRDGLRRVAIEERRMMFAFTARRDELAGLLAGMQAVGRAPEPLLLIHPEGPLGTARSAMIMAELAPAMRTRALALRDQLQDLQVIRAIQEAALDDLQDGLAGMQEARVALADAIAARQEPRRDRGAEADQLRRLVEDSDSLEGFAAGLAALTEDGTVPRATLPAKGTWPLPVGGRVLRRAGEADAAGIRRPGIVVTASPRALVTAPVAGTVRFAGGLLDYGNVLLIEPEAGTMLVLAGLAEVFVTRGEVLSAGDPLGHLGGESQDVAEFLNDPEQGSSAFRQESLYIELRQDGKTVDPQAWFATDAKQESQ